MSGGSGPAGPLSAEIARHRRATGGGGMKRRWLVQLDGGEEHVEADEVEITASGVLAFYLCASPMERDRTLLMALSPALWRRCQLEGER